MKARLSSRKFIVWVTLAAAVTGLVHAGVVSPAQADGSLNVLTWCDHEDAGLLQPSKGRTASR